MTDQSTELVPTDECAGCGFATAPIGSPCPVCSSLSRRHEVTISWNTQQPRSLARALMGSDWDAIASSLPGLEQEMTATLRENAQAVRAGRVREFVFDDNDPLDAADIADLTRRLAAVSDVLGRLGKALTNVGKAALQEVAVDALETKLPRVKVPLSEGGPTVVAARQTEITTTFKDDRILAVIAEMTVAEKGVAAYCDVTQLVGLGDNVGGGFTLEQAEQAYEAGLRTGARYGVDAAVGMRTKSDWKITAVKGLAEQLLAKGHDRLSKIMAQAFTQTKDFTDEYKVTVEMPK